MLALFFCFVALIASSAFAQNVVTQISVPVGGSIHVTIYDVYSDTTTALVTAANSTWTSSGPMQIGNIDPDSTGTGWIFSGTQEGSTTAVATDTANNVTGPALKVTVTPAGTPPTITTLQYTSP